MKFLVSLSCPSSTPLSFPTFSTNSCSYLECLFYRWRSGKSRTRRRGRHKKWSVPRKSNFQRRDRGKNVEEGIENRTNWTRRCGDNKDPGCYVWQLLVHHACIFTCGMNTFIIRYVANQYVGYLCFSRWSLERGASILRNLTVEKAVF